jgi:hypothetical protein
MAPVASMVTWRTKMLRADIDEILQGIPKLPDTAVVPIAVAARHDSVSERTVRRTYPLVRLSPNRKGVPVSFLRSRATQVAA